MEHIKTIYTGTKQSEVNHEATGCGECQTSCQSACKTSCTVANQNCEQTA
ncbi:MAG: six-cysteine ranthipeptide SCIFF [Defluviitaleaceae bacterium]|nr:six-cysteine ranthipeptide SCIFF [Defluviitaleaceae bacterium]